jgi:cell fate (sporulation/competence/biofilm development) regulator YlbF (YheA/YmcA/DUF963 family)
MSEAILKKARELGLELYRSKEYNDVREAEIMMLQNPEAQSIIQEFQNKQYELQGLQAQGLPLTEAQQREFGEFQMRMFDNTYISNFFKAQQSFEHILDQVNKIISDSIGINQGCGCDEEECDCGC